MEKNKALRLVNLLLVIVFVVGALVGNAYLILESDSITFKVASAISSVALVSALIYVLEGGSKSEAIFFKIFAALFCLSELLSVSVIALENKGSAMPFFLLLNAVCFGIIFVLTFIKDLGRKKSFILCLIFLALRLVGVIDTLVGLIASNAMFPFIQAVSELILAGIIATCILNKYLDKAKRKGNVEENPTVPETLPEQPKPDQGEENK